MMDGRERKQSGFLLDLAEYYKAREKHSNTFSEVPCPQNFIPGATKAKPNVKFLRKMSRKVSSVCYRGVVIQMKDSMTAVEKGLIPAGLLALGVPSPSQHTSCLEHKLEKLWQTQLTDSLPRIEESLRVDDVEIGADEDKMLLEVVRSSPRGCSMPSTSRDIGSLPVSCCDDSFVAEFRQTEHPGKRKRMSYPLTCTEYENYGPRLYKFRSFHQKPVDSVAKLNALCRGMSYYGSTSFKSRSRESDGTPTREGERARHFKAYNVLPFPQDLTLAKGNAEFQWQRDAIFQENAGNESTGKNSERSIELQTKKISDDSNVSDVREPRLKTRGDSLKKKTFKKRFTLRRTKSSKEEAEDDDWTSDKQTLSQIQNALRSKLPKTLQTTVKMGLSFDPITVKERNNQGRECNTLTEMLASRNRSQSTPGSQELMTRKNRSKTFTSMLPVPSLLVSTPPTDIEDEKEEKASLLDNLKKFGKNTLTRHAEKIMPARLRGEQKPPSYGSMETLKPLTPTHVKKLGNLLGPEFRAVYAKERSNSMPLIRKKRKGAVVAGPPVIFARSTSEIDSGIIQPPKFLDLWSSYDTSDSELSGAGGSWGVSMDGEMSDREDLYCSGRVDSVNAGSKEPKCVEDVQKDNVSSPEIVIFLPKREVKVDIDAETDSNPSNTQDSGSGEKDDSTGKGSSTTGNGNQEGKNSCNTLSDLGDATARSHSSQSEREVTCVVEQEKPGGGVNALTNSILSKGIDGKFIADKFSLRAHTEYVSISSSRSLKTSKELLEESKAGHLKDHLKGINGKSDTGADTKENEIALQELDALIKELESYEI